MNTWLVLCYLALGIVVVVFFWRLTAGLRRQLKFDRAVSNPAVIEAVLWWTRELRNVSSAKGSATVASGQRTAAGFRTAMMQLLATKFASDKDALHDDIGSARDCSTLLSEVCRQSGIDISRCFPPAIRMRIRDHHVLVSRSGGAFWETIWQKI